MADPLAEAFLQRAMSSLLAVAPAALLILLFSYDPAVQTKLIRSDFTPLGPTDPFALFTETELVPDKAFKLGTLDLSDQ